MEINPASMDALSSSVRPRAAVHIPVFADYLLDELNITVVRGTPVIPLLP